MTANRLSFFDNSKIFTWFGGADDGEMYWNDFDLASEFLSTTFWQGSFGVEPHTFYTQGSVNRFLARGSLDVFSPNTVNLEGNKV